MIFPSFRLHALHTCMKYGAVVRAATATAYIRTTRSNISAHLAVKIRSGSREEEGRENLRANGMRARGKVTSRQT